MELTQALVAFPTVRAEQSMTGPAFTGMARFLEEWASSAGVRFHSVYNHEIWELSLGEGPVGTAFLLHGDVVPAGEGWTRKPFEAVLEGDKLYGRGT